MKTMQSALLHIISGPQKMELPICSLVTSGRINGNMVEMFYQRPDDERLQTKTFQVVKHGEEVDPSGEFICTMIEGNTILHLHQIIEG